MVTILDYRRSSALPSSTTTMTSSSNLSLEERFDVIKEIGDGSFGSVVLARTRTAGGHVAKRGTMIAIKTMKKTFDNFAQCLELREVIFLRSLPPHVHLVPALDIFLDPFTKKLHIAMEHMDGNLYQLMKARDHRSLDGASVKSILFQILSGMEHIHQHNFFHRDIKPENILISTPAPADSGHSSSSFKRYSTLVTPPTTPVTYSVKIADFGLARETKSKLPYTTYVSTRWYRAPEVLLRAGEYSAPVDMWAFGAMAVEVATLKPLFPGGNEVDQVWRVCEIMGSPGTWYDRSGQPLGGGEWRDGTKLAAKLGFSFPKMAPHSMTSILQQPQWPVCFAQFVTWCLMWDPVNRPTSTQALAHAYFADAVDPLDRPKSGSRLLGRKAQSSAREIVENQPVQTTPHRTSWFRRSLIARESAPAVPTLSQVHVLTPQLSPVPTKAVVAPALEPAARPIAAKRATWQAPSQHAPQVGAPMPVLPTIRPISPLSSTVNVQAHSHSSVAEVPSSHKQESNHLSGSMADKSSKKLGRQLSVASHGNHYGDANRVDNGGSGVTSPTQQKEGFFSHLRKRARRLSGRQQLSRFDDVEAMAGVEKGKALNGNGTIASINESFMPSSTLNGRNDFSDLDKALQNVKYSLDNGSNYAAVNPSQSQSSGYASQPQTLHQSQSHSQLSTVAATNSNTYTSGFSSFLKRQTSLNGNASTSTMQPRGSFEEQQPLKGPISSRTRRALNLSQHPAHRYETPDEEEELLDEALHGVRSAVAVTNPAHGQSQTSARVVLPPIQAANPTAAQQNITATASNYLSPTTTTVRRSPALYHSASFGGVSNTNYAQLHPYGPGSLYSPALASTSTHTHTVHPSASHSSLSTTNPYPTPSPSAKRSGTQYTGLMETPQPYHSQSATQLHAQSQSQAQSHYANAHSIYANPLMTPSQGSVNNSTYNTSQTHSLSASQTHLPSNVGLGMSAPVNIRQAPQRKENVAAGAGQPWPTPPYEESEWANRIRAENASAQQMQF